jgi:hypothetical protein
MQAMKLFNRQKDDQEVTAAPVEAETPKNNKTVEEILQGSEGRQRRINWRQTIPRLLVTLIVIVILAGGVLWAFGVFDGNSSDSDKDKPAPIAQNDKNAPTGDTNSSDETNSSSGSSNSSSNAGSGGSQSGSSSNRSSSSASNAGSTQNAGSTAGQLVATGPAETILVFITASLTGVVIYQTALRRQHR